MEQLTQENRGQFTYFFDTSIEFTLSIPHYWDQIYKGKPREKLYDNYIQMLNWVKKCPKNKTVLDIGVNHALFAVPCHLLGYNVLGFEPVKSNFQDSVDNMRSNGCENPQIYNYALSDNNEATYIYIPECPDNSSLNKDAAIANMKGKNYEQQLVQCIKFDDFIKHHPEYNNIGFIKIDTQGAEYSIIFGMQEFLKQARDIYLIAEYEEHLMKMGHTYSELNDLILSLGFGYTTSIGNDRLYYKP